MVLQRRNSSLHRIINRIKDLRLWISLWITRKARRSEASLYLGIRAHVRRSYRLCVRFTRCSERAREPRYVRIAELGRETLTNAVGETPSDFR
jgi:hypothetical protein